MNKVAIVSTNKFKYSETFIHAQIRGLPFEKWLLHGDYFPTHWSRGLAGEDHLLTDLKRSAWQFWQGRDAESCLLRWLKQEKIELVLAQYGPSGVAMMECCEKAGIPLLTHFHGYDAYREDILSAQGKRYPELFQGSAGQVVVSHAMREQLLGLGADPNRVHLIPYGVDLEKFRVSDPIKAKPVLVSVGRFTPKKAPHLLVRSFAHALKEVPEAKLVMVGEGEMEKEVEREIAHLGIGKSVQLLGRQSPQEVTEHLRKARAFVQHSLVPASGDSEGLPLSVLEAMACGLPILSTLHAGIPDAVRHEQEGLLGSEGDIVAMGKYMSLLLNDPIEAGRLGKNARKRVEKQYSVARYLQEMAALVAEVLRS